MTAGQWYPAGRDRGSTPQRCDGPDHDDELLLRSALVAALCLFLASMLPRELIAAALQLMFWFAGIGAAAVATIRGDAIDAPRWTHWDAAAVFYGASVLLSWQVDETMVRLAIEAAG